jgi:uncharacterized protein YyaL (SSP411 family)
MAVNAYAFIQSNMTAKDGRLHHSYAVNAAKHPATLDDYANLARAALFLYEATGNNKYIDAAKNWLAILDRYYWDAANGGYYFTASDTADIILRTKSIADHAVPAGNGIMIEVLTRLFYATGEDAWREKAEKIISCFAPELSRNFFPLATFLNAFEFSQNAVQVVAVIGDKKERAKILTELYALPAVQKTIAIVHESEKLPASHPASGKKRLNDQTTFYICRGMTCGAPTNKIADVGMELKAA